MFQHILVPLDGSTRAEQAVPVARRIARATSGSVHLVHVITPPIDYSGGLAPIPVVSEQVMESDIASANEYLQAIAKRSLPETPTTTEVLFGFPANCLLAAAADHECDLIVLCSHGRTGLDRWVLGSVAHTLVHESTVPLLVLYEESAASLVSARGTGRPLRVLVPLDGSALAEAALGPAASVVAALAAPGHASLHLAEVILPAQEAERRDVTRGQAETYLASVSQRLQATTKDFHLAITWSVLPGHDVAGALVGLAETEDYVGEGQQAAAVGGCDLAAMSTHGRHGLERWVMGSVTDRVLNTSRRPLLVVRPPM